MAVWVRERSRLDRGCGVVVVRACEGRGGRDQMCDVRGV